METTESLHEKIANLQKHISENRKHMKGEEVTKTSLVLPFLQALGYSIFNPSEVRAEYTADVGGIRKGEKVDYAIFLDGKIEILIECKSATIALNKEHIGQLFRYFSVENARLAILTNGLEYRFYSDLDADNKMDTKPFFRLDMTKKVDSHDIRMLEKFAKAKFNIDNIIAEAQNRRDRKFIEGKLRKEFSQTSDDFARLILKHLGYINVKKSDMYRLAPMVREAIAEIVGGEPTTPTPKPVPAPTPDSKPAPKPNLQPKSPSSKVTRNQVKSGDGKQVTFAMVVAKGIIPVGTKISNHEWKEQATVLVDGFVDYNGERYSTNQLAGRMSGRAANAWDYLQYERADGSRVKLHIAREELTRQSSQSPSPSLHTWTSRKAVNVVKWQGRQVTFAMVVAKGIIPVGTIVSGRDWTKRATVRADGLLDYNGEQLSINKFAQVVTGWDRVQSWVHLQYERADGSRVKLDDARQELIRRG